mmetsp:Transcript_23305/g.59585  ORF Transcript_23305/g.59585 Transcript_23305/m.59585 type:complete len:308 (-) Transcript_23305:640-1563(-)
MQKWYTSKLLLALSSYATEHAESKPTHCQLPSLLHYMPSLLHRLLPEAAISMTLVHPASPFAPHFLTLSTLCGHAMHLNPAFSTPALSSHPLPSTFQATCSDACRMLKLPPAPAPGGNGRAGGDCTPEAAPHNQSSQAQHSIMSLYMGISRYMRWSATLVHMPSMHAELWQEGSSPLASQMSTFWSTPPTVSTSTSHASRATWWKPMSCGGSEGTTSRLCVKRQLSVTWAAYSCSHCQLPTRGEPKLQLRTSVNPTLNLRSSAHSALSAPPMEWPVTCSRVVPGCAATSSRAARVTLACSALLVYRE